jgi:ribose-phosphate pyrophosphokinase
LVANLLEKAGVTRVLTMDLHTEQIQGFFDIPVDNLYARPLYVRVIREMGLSDLVIVSPDVGSNKLARKFAEDLKADIAIVDKRRVDETGGQVEVSALIGDVQGKNALIVDDICSTGSTLAAAARVCKREGAKAVYAFITHGFSVGKALDGSLLDGVYFADTIPGVETREGLSMVPTASLFGQAVQRLLAAESISSLFKS